MDFCRGERKLGPLSGSAKRVTKLPEIDGKYDRGVVRFPFSVPLKQWHLLCKRHILCELTLRPCEITLGNARLLPKISVPIEPYFPCLPRD